MDDLRANLLAFAIIFGGTQLTAFPIAGLIYAPDFPHPELLFGCSAIIAFMFLNVFLISSQS